MRICSARHDDRASFDIFFQAFANGDATHADGVAVSALLEPLAGTAQEALRQLDDAHDMWVEGVRSLGEAGLTRPQGPTQPPEFADAPMAKLVLYINLEVIHHGAEICLLRDLYERTRR